MCVEIMVNHECAPELRYRRRLLPFPGVYVPVLPSTLQWRGMKNPKTGAVLTQLSKTLSGGTENKNSTLRDKDCTVNLSAGAGMVQISH
jgi:hypothetical protein